jgi:methyl-accepting chemotaxis protein
MTRSFLWKLYVALGAAFALIVIPLVLWMTVTVINPLRELTAVAESYSQGQLDLKVPGTERKDEIGSLARALGRLGVSIRKAMERLKRAS